MSSARCGCRRRTLTSTTQALNLGTLRTNGVDLQSSYTLNAGEHRLGFNLVGTYLASTATLRCRAARRMTAWAFTATPAVFRRRSGVIRFRTNWRTPWHGLDIAATWRYFGDAKTERLSANPQLAGAVNANGIARMVFRPTATWTSRRA